MKKIIAEELYKSEPDKFKIFREWAKVNEKIVNFERKANVKTFQFLFGDEEGLRLCKHFKNECGGSVIKFESYLKNEQFNDLLINIYYNENLFII